MERRVGKRPPNSPIRRRGRTNKRVSLDFAANSNSQPRRLPGGGKTVVADLAKCNVEVNRSKEGAAPAPQVTCLTPESVPTIGSPPSSEPYVDYIEHFFVSAVA